MDIIAKLTLRLCQDARLVSALADPSFCVTICWNVVYSSMEILLIRLLCTAILSYASAQTILDIIAKLTLTGNVISKTNG